jgi:hypothetical protein
MGNTVDKEGEPTDPPSAVDAKNDKETADETADYSPDVLIGEFFPLCGAGSESLASGYKSIDRDIVIHDEKLDRLCTIKFLDCLWHSGMIARDTGDLTPEWSIELGRSSVDARGEPDAPAHTFGDIGGLYMSRFVLASVATVAAAVKRADPGLDWDVLFPGVGPKVPDRASIRRDRASKRHALDVIWEAVGHSCIDKSACSLEATLGLTGEEEEEEWGDAMTLEETALWWFFRTPITWAAIVAWHTHNLLIPFDAILFRPCMHYYKEHADSTRSTYVGGGSCEFATGSTIRIKDHAETVRSGVDESLLAVAAPYRRGNPFQNTIDLCGRFYVEGAKGITVDSHRLHIHHPSAPMYAHLCGEGAFALPNTVCHRGRIFPPI